LSLTKKKPPKNPQNLSNKNQNPSKKLPPKTLHVTNVVKKDHTSRFCWNNTNLHELKIKEEVIHHIQSLLIEASDTGSNPSDPFEELF
jgi:hypothetical protein